MILRSIVVLGAALIALPAVAAETRRAASPAHVSAALKAGCTVQQVHTPSGKTVQASPIIHCPDANSAIADATREAAPRAADVKAAS